MGTSLADGAWNRESAVYRITGVFTVIGGWFFTAFAAFSTAFLMAYLIHWGEIFSIIGLMAIAILLVIRTHIIHKRSLAESEKTVKEEVIAVTEKSLQAKCKDEVAKFYKNSSKNIYDTLNALIKDKRKPLVRIKNDLDEYEKQINKIKKKAHRNLMFLNDQDLEHGYNYLEVLDHLEIAFITQKELHKLVYKHIDNNLKPLNDSQNKDLAYFNEAYLQYEKDLLELYNKPDKKKDKLMDQKTELKDLIVKLQKKNVKLIKKNETSTKTSLMFQGVTAELRQYIDNLYELFNAYQKYIK